MQQYPGGPRAIPNVMRPPVPGLPDDHDPRTGLPPAGHARSEEIRRREDELAAQGEIMASSLDLHRINPAALRSDREIMAAAKATNILYPDKNYVYCWPNWQAAHGFQVRFKQAQGWEAVTRDMPEARGMQIAVDGHVRCGDVLLMRLRKDRKLVLDYAEAVKRKRRQGGSPNSRLQELGDRYRGRGVIVHTDMSDPRLQMYLKLGKAAADAQGHFNSAVTSGTVPGAPPPGYAPHETPSPETVAEHNARVAAAAPKYWTG